METRMVLAALGLPDHQYAGHSFRIGAAMSAAQEGVEDSTIQLLGRWQSSEFLHYIRTTHKRLEAVSSAIASQGRAE